MPEASQHEPRGNVNALTVGGLFDGAGLLALGLHQAGLRHKWMCESDPWRRELLAARFGVPVHDDIRTLHGQAVADAPAVDVIAGGFPCRGASTAGKRQGFDNAETVLWHEMARVISELRPRYVLIENVANILGMAAAPGEPAGSLWGIVLADLASLGFDAVWDCLPAGAVGAPHLRDRVFCVAVHAGGARWPAGRQPEHSKHGRPGDFADEVPIAATATPRKNDGLPTTPVEGERGMGQADRGDRRQPPANTNGRRGEAGAQQDQRATGRQPASLRDNADRRGVRVDWGDYQPAITRWEHIHGQAPAPLITRVRRMDDGNPDVQRVRARLDRSEMRAQRQRLSALGDGVHVYVARLAGLHIMSHARLNTENTE